MNRLAIKMLVGDRLKYLGLIAGMAFAAMMIAQQASIFFGLKSMTGTFVRELTGVDLWVMDEQVRFSEDQHPLPDGALYRIRGIAGVEWAVPLYKGWLRARLPDGSQFPMIVVGLDDATLTGGPAFMAEGSLSDLRRTGGVIIDSRDAGTKLRLARADGRALRVGDRFTLMDKDAVVVGSYHGSPSFFWDPVVYTTYTRAVHYAPRERNQLSFVLVKIRPDSDVEQVRGRIESVTSYRARTPKEFERVTAAYIMKATGILVNFGIAVGLGMIIGLLVTGQTFFNFTLDNLRHFAALKAMGTSNATLIRMVLVQVLTVASLSFGIGVGVASITGEFIRRTDLAFLMPWQVPVFTAAAILAIAGLAGCLSLAKVLRLEPAVVFKT